MPSASATAAARPVSSGPLARLGALPEGVPAAPATCGVAQPSATPRCPDAPGRLTALEVALREHDAAKRDQLLADLEPCSVFRAGILRALRAELRPGACADGLVVDYFEHPLQQDSPSEKLDKNVEDALLGLALAARLARLVHEPPGFEPPYDKAHFREFFETRLSPWIRAQATAIQTLSTSGSLLTGYGKGVAAIAAGLADMRFIEVVRDVKLPEELARDPELRDTYYASLDQALEPRKARGRDAALVGLRQFAAEGVLADTRVDEARKLLSTLYSGRRIDALDGLLLPALPAPAQATVEQRLAASLPTFYAGALLELEHVNEPDMLRALLERGLPPGASVVLHASKLTPEARALYARGLLALGQRYWQNADFRAAAILLIDVNEAPTAEASLISALAHTLTKGPRDAADMMLRGPLVPSGLLDVSALDALARSKTAVGGLAAYDAAYITSLVPPAEPAPEFFNALAVRFRRAAERLKDPAQRRLAIERADAAQATARAIH